MAQQEERLHTRLRLHPLRHSKGIQVAGFERQVDDFSIALAMGPVVVANDGYARIERDFDLRSYLLSLPGCPPGILDEA